MARRNKSIKIPVSEIELQVIRELANENNLSMATYLRNLALQNKRREVVK